MRLCFLLERRAHPHLQGFAAVAASLDLNRSNHPLQVRDLLIDVCSILSVKCHLEPFSFCSRRYTLQNVDVGDPCAPLPASHEAPLHVAARRGDVEMVELLLLHNARADAKTLPALLTPLHVCAAAGQLGVLHLLLRPLIQGSESSGNSNSSSSSGNDSSNDDSSGSLRVSANMARALLRAKSASGHTALMLAARGGHTELLPWLLRCGSLGHGHGHGLNVCDSSGHTALSLALGQGHLKAAAFMIGRGARVGRPVARLFAAGARDARAAAENGGWQVCILLIEFQEMYTVKVYKIGVVC